jgi:hypothetical protein
MPTRCNRWFLLQILLLAQHVPGHHYAHHQELESIIQVAAVCGIWCFGFQVVGMVWSWGLCVRFAGCSSVPHRTDNLKTKAPYTTGRNHLYNTLELLMMGIMVPETCWASNTICNKNHVASSWHFISTYHDHYLRSKLSMKIFVQNTPGMWQRVSIAVSKELDALTDSKAAGSSFLSKTFSTSNKSHGVTSQR